MDRPDMSLEQAGYLEFRGAHLYSVLHGAPDPLARVLLVGPFASERHFSYTTWVRWARFLAARRIEALRFDYRGIGESTGQFEDLSFSDWSQDAEFLAEFLQRRRPQAPLVLHGLEMGALLAGMVFSTGIGEALLSWGPPPNANEVLRRPLSRQAFKNLYLRKSMSDYIADLESNHSMEVEGYLWKSGLWKESFQLQAAPAPRDQTATAHDNGKPLRTVPLEGSLASVFKGSAMGYIAGQDPDLTEFFTENYAWIVQALRLPTERNIESRYRN
jgi:pimeloyl-ACP methyl ester carboxylesterase